MANCLLLAVLVAGFSGITAQVLIIRELLVSFYGNELTLGLILANWVISVAAGALAFGKLIELIKHKIRFLIIIQAAFSLFLLNSIYFARSFKSLLGIPFGETLGLAHIFFVSLFLIFPIASLSGGLFSLNCGILSDQLKNKAAAVSRVYSLEAIGAIAGGIVLTCIFLPLFNTFQIILLVFTVTLFVSIFLYRYIKSRLAGLIIFSFTLITVLFYLGLGHINKASLSRQWDKGKLIDYQNSIYGNVAVTEENKQTTFFYNGYPIVVVPYPDISFIEEFANYPLLFHDDPKTILILGGGAGGLINETLKHRIFNITYLEIDPLIIKMLGKHPSDLTNSELSDKRVKLLNQDSVNFIKTTSSNYDVILIGTSNPSELLTNRLLTKEFFSSAKKRLNKGGILAFWLPGSPEYLSKELKNINGTILNGSRVFTNVRVIPGDYNIILASDTEKILNLTPENIEKRIEGRGIKSRLLIPDYLVYKLGESRQRWFRQAMAGATTKINQDFKPISVFESILLWNKKFSPLFGKMFKYAGSLNLLKLILLVIFLAGIVYILTKITRMCLKLSIGYSIFTTGFFGMMANLLLTFSFQVIYGYLYYVIGLLLSIFMSGIAFGSIFMMLNLSRIRDGLKVYLRLELSMIIYLLLLGRAVLFINENAQTAFPLFLVLFFISGALTGIQFPLACKIFLNGKDSAANTAGTLYFADLSGGWLAGIFGGVVFLPVLGLLNTCYLVAILKVSSLFLVTLLGKLKLDK